MLSNSTEGSYTVHDVGEPSSDIMQYGLLKSVSLIKLSLRVSSTLSQKKKKKKTPTLEYIVMLGWPMKEASRATVNMGKSIPADP